LWFAATCLLALSPLLYFVSGASDDATEAGRIGFAAIPPLISWPLLAVAISLARRRRAGPAARAALLLMLYAGGVLFLARRLGETAAVHGDAAWTLFWAASVLVWVVLSAALGRRPMADT
jgi:hypothetical protein